MVTIANRSEQELSTLVNTLVSNAVQHCPNGQILIGAEYWDYADDGKHWTASINLYKDTNFVETIYLESFDTKEEAEKQIQLIHKWLPMI